MHELASLRGDLGAGDETLVLPRLSGRKTVLENRMEATTGHRLRLVHADPHDPHSHNDQQVLLCPRCAGDGLNRTTRHMDRNGNDTPSDGAFVPCWVCKGSGQVLQMGELSSRACEEAFELEEGLAAAYPSIFPPRPKKFSRLRMM